mmetsp:Transcript_41030/g.107769  ORF Transcript_41030/g.107769 Transcript_41030/m.107769 type:complete len:316 (+) Transcript_41030:39-986(+)
MKRLPLVYHRLYSVEPWDASHRFVMKKYRLLYEHLERTELVRSRCSVHTPTLPSTHAWLHRVHCPQYVEQYCDGTLAPAKIRRIGLPWTPGVVESSCLEVYGTTVAAKLALEHGISCNLGGGTHHAHYDFGAGYNAFNDLVTAAYALLDGSLASRILIIDLDVHQGDGTAALTADNPAIYAMSVHSEQAFPLRKSKSSLDIGLPTGTGDDEYMAKLRDSLFGVLEDFRPDFVFYDAGVDCFKDDGVKSFCRGHLGLTLQGMRQRDEFVLRECTRRGIPVATVIGGGYAPKGGSHEEVAARHAIVHEVAADVIQTC